MAAYAALASLMKDMERIQNHPRHSFSFDEKQLESLGENVGFLLDFVEAYSHGGGEEIEALESRIAAAAYAAEDVIESSAADQIQARSSPNGETSSCFLADLQKLIEDMDSIKEMATKVKAQRGSRERLATYPLSATSSRPLATGKNTMVGLDDQLMELLDVLTGQQSSRQVIPIVGMGGIGKTTLARHVYEHSLIVRRFDVRAWATISQEHSTTKILLELLSSLGKSVEGTVDELGEKLHQRLYGRRYLIILDDMWSTDAWDDIKSFLLDNGNGSRIVITTRLSNMSFNFSSSSLVMNLLDENTSWKLLCQRAFGGEDCPPELEEIGKQIVKKCKGLPLSIVVVGGHLGKSSWTKEYWGNIANNINSILDSEEDGQGLNILSLSYSHMPTHLKPCFLYMGSFPEDHEIFVPQLIKLWVAEGFLKPNETGSFEMIAEDYLKDLIDRNLVSVHSWSWNGKILTCKIHDLLRELCLKLVEKEKFRLVLNTPGAGKEKFRFMVDTPGPNHRNHDVVIHENIPFKAKLITTGDILELEAEQRVLTPIRGEDHALEVEEASSGQKTLRLLNTVKKAPNDGGVYLMEDTFQQVNLRYLHCETQLLEDDHLRRKSQSRKRIWSLPLPSSISLLWNLETLIISCLKSPISVPSEIWEMPQLRHLLIKRFFLPSDRLDKKDDFMLQNLQTLSEVVNFRFSEEVCRRIPNIKELHLYYDDFLGKCEASSYYCPHSIGCFLKLESLKCSFPTRRIQRDLVLSLTFPSSLRELCLYYCGLYWEELKVIGSLPHLEVLKLGLCSVLGPEWNPVEGEFLHLKSLIIDRCSDLISWNANNSHFPVLENLALRFLFELKEIPLGIGEIPTLRLIHLGMCSMSAANSAVKILMEQESLGNEGLQVEILFEKEQELMSVKEMVQEEGFTSNNLHLSSK